MDEKRREQAENRDRRQGSGGNAVKEDNRPQSGSSLNVGQIDRGASHALVGVLGHKYVINSQRPRLTM